MRPGLLYSLLRPYCPNVLSKTQLSMKFVQLINPKLLTTADSFLLNKTEHENFSTNKYENANWLGLQSLPLIMEFLEISPVSQMD